MADPADAATAPANDDDVDDLYADLDDQVTAALAAVGESGGSNAKDSDPATDAEADAIEAVDLGDGLAGYSSSDEESEDDLHIVLNEDGCAPPPPSAGRCEEGWPEESEERELRSSLLKGLSVNDGGRRKLNGVHYKGPLDKTTVPITGQGDLGHQHAFQKDYYFFLPRNRTVFDINIEAFQQKPWRQHGIDLTDYFNFGLDEEGWRKYCFVMKQFTQGASSLAEQSSGMDQESHHNLESSKLMPKSAIYSGFEGGNDVAKPKGRAIHVQGGVFERLPSADMWRPRERDSDVVIQVNMMLSPSNHSTSDDNSTVNEKCMTTERILVNDPGVKCLEDTSLLVDKVVHKEVLNGGSSECTGIKLYMRDSACTRDHSSSPRYSDMLSEESTEDCYFKRANRHPNSKPICSDTGPKDVYVKSDFCLHSSKSDQESTKGGSPSRTPCPADDRYHKTTTPLRTDEPDFVSSGVFMNRQSDHRLLKYGHQGRKEQKRKGSAHVRHDVFEKEVKIADSYTSRYDRKYEEKRSTSTFLLNDWRDAVHNQVYEKRDYSPDERSAMRNGVHRFSAISNHHHNRFSSHEFNDGGDGVRSLSPPKGWQRRHDHGYGYKSVLRAELSDDIDSRMYRESYCQESRRVRHGHSEDDELLDYNDHRFVEFWEPEVRGKYRSRRFAESSGEHWRHPYHLVSPPRANDYPKNPERDWYVSPPRANDYPKNPERDWYVSPPRANDYPKNPERDWCSPPRANDYPKNPERDWSSPGLTPLSSRNSRNAKIMQYRRDGYYQNDKHHDFSVHVDNIQQSAIYTAAPSETGYCIRPVKRKLHAGRGSMNRKDLLGVAISKGRRLKHDQSMISDRQLYAVEVHNSSKETVREAIYSFSDMRNSNSISNIHDEGRHEHLNIHPEDADGIRLNDRKRKFKRQGNEIRCVESDNEGCLPADKDLHSFKHKDVHQKAQKLKLNRSHHQSVCQDLEKTTYQKRQTTNGEDEIEEGELVEEDHQVNVPIRKLNKPRKAALKSVIEASSAGQLETINAMPKDICDKGATRECDDKHILKVMEKMQKRRERFKEPVVVVAQKEEDSGKNELPLAVAYGADDDVKNQRPARKRRWGGKG